MKLLILHNCTVEDGITFRVWDVSTKEKLFKVYLKIIKIMDYMLNDFDDECVDLDIIYNFDSELSKARNGNRESLQRILNWMNENGEIWRVVNLEKI